MSSFPNEYAAAYEAAMASTKAYEEARRKRRRREISTAEFQKAKAALFVAHEAFDVAAAIERSRQAAERQSEKSAPIF